jgi:hypothetical protein
MRTTQAIGSFSDFFEDQVRLVSSFKSDPIIYGGSSDPMVRVAMHKKILYCAIFDSLARVRYYGQGLTNRARFVRFTKDHGNWAEGRLISVPVLAERLAPTRTHLRL